MLSAACNLLIVGLLWRSQEKVSEVGFALLYPAVRLGAILFQSILNSDSGANNAVGLIVLSILLNFVLCAGLFFLLAKLARVSRRQMAGR